MKTIIKVFKKQKFICEFFSEMCSSVQSFWRCIAQLLICIVVTCGLGMIIHKAYFPNQYIDPNLPCFSSKK